MTKKDGKSPSSSQKTNDLINQAVHDLGGEITLEEASDDLVEITGDKSPSKEQVAKIDLQQFVDKEAYMRLAADFDNFRRRALKERKEWERQGQEKVLREVLDVLDNFQRGLVQAEGDDSALATGMRMVYSQIEGLLKQAGLERIPTVGSAFDPSIHEAVARLDNDSVPDGQIVEELKCGFRWSDRLLRPASVVVAKSSSPMKVDSKDDLEGAS